MATRLPNHALPRINVVVVSAFVFMVFAWFSGRYGFSILWISLLCAAFYAIYLRMCERIWRSEEDSCRRSYMTSLSTDKYSSESCEWVNLLLERYWQVAEMHACAIIQTKVNAILKESCPKTLKSVVLKHISFGKHSPMISNLKTTSRTIDGTGMDAVIVNGTVSIHAPDLLVIVALTLVGLPMPMTIKLSDVEFTGVARISLSLCKEFPHIKNISICMLKPPDLDLRIEPLVSVNIMDLPAISSLIKNQVHAIVADTMVHPNTIVVPVTKFTPVMASSYNATYIVIIKIIRATGLAGTEIADSLETSEDEAINSSYIDHDSGSLTDSDLPTTKKKSRKSASKIITSVGGSMKNLGGEALKGMKGAVQAGSSAMSPKNKTTLWVEIKSTTGKCKTDAVRKYCPIWNASFGFLVEDPGIDSFTFTLMSRKAIDTNLGSTEILVSEWIKTTASGSPWTFETSLLLRKGIKLDMNVFITPVENSKIGLIDLGNIVSIPSQSNVADTGDKKDLTATEFASAVKSAAEMAWETMEPSVRENRNYHADSTTGLLSIMLHGAIDLLSVDNDGSSNSYVVITLGGVKHFKSAIIKNSDQPIWKEMTSLIVTSDVYSSEIIIEVWNHNASSRNELIGRAFFNSVALIRDPNEEVFSVNGCKQSNHIWLPLSLYQKSSAQDVKKGLIDISFTFIPVHMPDTDIEITSSIFDDDKGALNTFGEFTGGVLYGTANLAKLGVSGVAGVGGLGISGMKGMGNIGMAGVRGVGQGVKAVGKIGRSPKSRDNIQVISLSGHIYKASLSEKISSKRVRVHVGFSSDHEKFNYFVTAPCSNTSTPEFDESFIIPVPEVDELDVIFTIIDELEHAHGRATFSINTVETYLEEQMMELPLENDAGFITVKLTYPRTGLPLKEERSRGGFSRVFHRKSKSKNHSRNKSETLSCYGDYNDADESRESVRRSKSDDCIMEDVKSLTSVDRKIFGLFRKR